MVKALKILLFVGINFFICKSYANASLDGSFILDNYYNKITKTLCPTSSRLSRVEKSLVKSCTPTSLANARLINGRLIPGKSVEKMIEGHLCHITVNCDKAFKKPRPSNNLGNISNNRDRIINSLKKQIKLQSKSINDNRRLINRLCKALGLNDCKI